MRKIQKIILTAFMIIGLMGAILILFTSPLQAEESIAALPRSSENEVTQKPLIKVLISFHLVKDLIFQKESLIMENWITPDMIEQSVMAELNRIWRPAQIEWIVKETKDSTTRPKDRESVIQYLLNSKRDEEGKGDPERISRLNSILKLNESDPKAINIYLIPYLGGSSQGNTSPSEKRVIMGEWSDKDTHGNELPKQCLLVESGEFNRGSFSRTLAHELGHALGLKHPEKKVPPFNRLMGGTNPGYDLTLEEQKTARSQAQKIISLGIASVENPIP